MTLSRLRTFRRLTSDERRTFLQASVLLPLIGTALRLCGFARCQALLSRIVPGPETGGRDGWRLEPARVSARMVRLAAERGLYRATCLPQSLVLWTLLKRQGTATALRIGVRKTSERFGAHAWVEFEGVALNDDADVHERFAAFDRAIAR